MVDEEVVGNAVMVTVCGMVEVLLLVDVTSTAWKVTSEAENVLVAFLMLPPPLPV